MDEMKKNKLEEMELDGVTGGSLRYPFRKKPPQRGGCVDNVHAEVANNPIDMGEPGNSWDIIKNLKP